MNYYQFHIGDYAVHTRHLSLMEDLAYRRLIDWYYTNEKPIPSDPDKAARLIGMQDQAKEVSNILSDFFIKSDAGYINKRCDKEISKYKEKADRAKNANSHRWKSETDLKSDANSDADRIPTTNQEPGTNNQVTTSPDGEATPYRQIIELYQTILPACPKVAKLTDARKRHVRARWMDDLSSLDKWRNYFTYVSESDFLTGRKDGRDGRPPFLADFDWLIKQANVVKVAEGKYHRSE